MVCNTKCLEVYAVPNGPRMKRDVCLLSCRGYLCKFFVVANDTAGVVIRSRSASLGCFYRFMVLCLPPIHSNPIRFSRLLINWNKMGDISL